MEQLSGDLLKQYTDFIYDISGMRFSDSKAYYLSSKINLRREATGMTTFQEYLGFLKSPQAKTQEHTLLLNEITINETFFFRNQPQLDAFEQEVLKPVLADKLHKGNRRLRIWSCAASTGDEAYTTALQLLAMPEAKGFTLEIIGTDISHRAIESAQKGQYSKYAVRNLPTDIMQRHFTPLDDGNRFQLSDEIRRMVKFQHANLMDSNKLRMLGKFDIAICRNVLIYFDNASKEVVLKNIYDALNDDSYLLVGHSENLYGYRHLFTQCKDKTASLAYQKSPPGTQKLNV